jgi:putative peptidoglycan lipid II flippase
MTMAAISVAANIMLGIVLMRPLAHNGLALATSLASVLNLGLLVFELRRKLGSLGWQSICKSAIRTMVVSAIMGAVVWGAARILIPAPGAKTFLLFLGLSGCVMTGLIVFASLSYFLKSPELISIVAELKKGTIKQ